VSLHAHAILRVRFYMKRCRRLISPGVLEVILRRGTRLRLTAKSCHGLSLRRDCLLLELALGNEVLITFLETETQRLGHEP